MRFLLLCAAPLFAQSLNDARRQANPEMYALLEAARAAPPEFAAWGILKVLEGGAIGDKKWALDLIHEALEASRAARHPLPRRLAAGKGKSYSRAGVTSSAYALGLDRLTLSMRAIEHLRRIDPAAAREKFHALPRPVAASPACEDPFVDDPGAWYRTLRTLGPTRDEVMLALSGIRSHSEIRPAAAVILSRRGPLEELPVYAGMLAQALTTVQTSDRAFSAALSGASSQLGELAFSMKTLQEPRAALEEGWKNWLITGLAQPPCAENTDPEPRRLAVEEFTNKTGIAIAPDDWKPKAAEAKAEVQEYKTGASEARFRKLLFGSGKQAVSPAEKETPEWKDEFRRYIQAIETDSQASNEDARDFFIRRCQAWSGALFVAPPSEERDRALRQFLAFLLTNGSHIDPVLWFAQAEAISESTRSLYGDGHRNVLDALEQTGHPILALYARLEKVLPTRPAPPVH